MTTTTTMPQTVRMRPLAPGEDYITATEILTSAAQNDQDAFEALVPSSATCNPVEIAEDGSAAVFEVYAGSEWMHRRTDPPIARIIVRR